MAYKKKTGAEEPTVLRRQKILYLIKLLFEETDSRKGISQPKIKEYMETKGISVDRKAMYYDIQTINAFCRDNDIDFEITSGQGRSAEYRVTVRPFEQGELKLLCDAVSSAKFISENSAKTLIEKISRLGEKNIRSQLKRNLVVMSRKCVDAREGSRILFNVDQINLAIENKKKISFQYFRYDTNGKKIRRKDIRVVSPYHLVWNEEQYYLLGWYEDENGGGIRTFRVDRMGDVAILEDADAVPAPKDYKVSDRVNQAFSMFTGETTNVKLRFTGAQWMNAVIDRFGTKVRIIESTPDSFTIRAAVQPSSPFYGWLFQFGKDVEILSPAEVRDEYRTMVKELNDAFSDKN